MVLTSPYALDTPATRGPIVVTTVFGFLAVLTTFMRIISRRMRKLPFEADDYFIPVALFFLFAEYGLQIACHVAGGVGRHAVDIDPEDVVKTLKLILPFEALYGVILMFIKLSILHFYLRIFGSDKHFRWAAYGVGAIVVMWMMSVVIETFLLCRPLAYNWDQSIAGVCGQRNTVYVSAGVINMITDVMCMVLPAPTIWKLQLPLARKIALIFLFSLGIFITIISIIRIESLLAISFTDPTWTLPSGLMWTVLEPELGIINANLPVIRPLLVSLFPRIFGSTRERRSTRNTDPKKFERLDEGAYPLAHMGDKSGAGVSSTHEVAVGKGETGTGSRSEESIDGGSGTGGDVFDLGITVTTEWGFDQQSMRRK
ncbi:hypothetical protein K490DRAFT_65599 [Saccharata proteae CBS 121410]|uniref:Rhodopsin domain-containing protein n=1 Tax=Saccharata proteae CBS 121410 TaxID=1314787 RepID=A0A9P4HTK1_9PEZI|nr:hypothetical protein K490DRAFT_65599 [Saccharata proteae CBS 121410]